MNIAVVGVRHGHIRSVIRYVQNHPEHRLVGVVDSDESLRRAYTDELSVPGYATLDELLSDQRVDAVGLAPVNSEKARIAATCLAQGIHVVADKPVATSLADLEELERAAKSSQAILSVLLTLRFSPEYATARRLIQEGAIGRLVHAWLCRPHKLNRSTRPDWMFSRETYGGIIVDLAIHDLDIFRWVTGATHDQIAHLTALHGNYGTSGDPDFEDAGHILLRLRDGTVGAFEASWLTPAAAPYHGDTRAIFTGTEGTIEVLPLQRRVVLVTAAKGPEDVPLVTTHSAVDDFFRGIEHGPDAMVLPPAEALESTRWTLLAREAADAVGRVSVFAQ